jgi:hypothetical protein
MGVFNLLKAMPLKKFADTPPNAFRAYGLQAFGG